MTGQTSYHAGRVAEDQVARVYQDSGHNILARRWRGTGGEIDLITERDGEVVFVEVKKSRSVAQAALALSQRQQKRLLASAEACLGTFPRGALTPCRFDVALVDAVGRVEIVANALTA